MRKLALVALVAAIHFLPQPASAQVAPKAGDVFGLNSSQVVAIGVGIVGGIIVTEAVIVSAPAYLGAAVGGLVGNWWYAQKANEEVAVKK